MKHKYTMVRMVLLMALLVAGLTVAAVPGSAQEFSATLWIYGQISSDTTATVWVHQVTSVWTETGVTWNSQPSYNATAAGSFTSGLGWLSVDVTALVQAWAGGTATNYGLLLEQDLSGFTRYYSREGLMPPHLELCIDGACETRYPVADAYIYALSPNTNTGANIFLYTGLVNGYEKQSLLKFEIPDIPPPPCGEGCTPGYWKNHLDSWGPTGYSPGDDFDTVFSVDYFNPDITLFEAVWLGGGGVNVLARHGTAALLSAVHPDVEYPFTEADVIALVQAGNVAPLVEANELGCPIE